MEFFKEIMASIYGEEISQKIIEGSLKKRKTTFRINTLKTTTENILNILKNENIGYKISDFSDTAVIIESGEEKIRELPCFENGEIYLQSLSSQLPPLLLCPNEKQDILDMTAAPGGKTSQIAMLCNNKCNITACEMNIKRAERLKYNLAKQGVTCANVMVTDARRLESYFSFDKILLDAPCSGSGTLNLNNPKSYSGFSKALISKCVSAQSALLDKALSVLKPGGEVVYSTCSVLPEENEKVVEKFLKKHNCSTVTPSNELIKNLPLLPCALEDAVCVCPSEEYEGFFLVKIKKNL